jgi:hypothetical protein
MTAPLFAFPPQAAFDRVLPKNKIYEHARPSNAVRALFVSHVDQIIWRYKLSPETVNLPARVGVPEIEVLEILLKTSQLDESILCCIDKAIPFPILFQIRHEDRIRMVATYKRPSELDARKWITSLYFASDWVPAGRKRVAMPIALDLGGLYEQLIRELLPFPPHKGEPLRAQVERLAQLRSLQADCKKLELRLRKEKQFNRKVELNARLRTLKSELNSLAN